MKKDFMGAIKSAQAEKGKLTLLDIVGNDVDSSMSRPITVDISSATNEISLGG